MNAPMSTADHAALEQLQQRVQELEKRLDQLQKKLPEDRLTMVVFSGELDRVLAALIIATGAAAMGQKVSMFFTFWGLNALRKDKRLGGKPLAQKLMTLLAPSGPGDLPLSRMHFFGAGAAMLRHLMKQKNVSSLEELFQLARELGVRMVACEMSRDVMGIDPQELVPELEFGGVATFLGDALRSRATLFI